MKYKIEILNIPEGTPSSMLTDGRLFLDLGGVTIIPIKKIGELTDVKHIKIDGAFTSSLKKSLINRFVLDPLVTSPSNRRLEIRLWINHTVLDQNFLYATARTNSYSIRLISGENHWAVALKDTILNEIFPDSARMITSEEDIKESWDNVPYVKGADYWIMPFVDYGKFLNPGSFINTLNAFNSGNQTGIRIEDVRPWFSLRWILEKMFADKGWKLECQWLETDIAAHMFVYILRSNYNKDERDIKNLDAIWSGSTVFNTYDRHLAASAQGFTGDPNFAQMLTIQPEQVVSTGWAFTETLVGPNWWYDGTKCFTAACEGSIGIRGIINFSGNNAATLGGFQELYINLHFLDNDGQVYTQDTQSFVVEDADNPESIEVDFAFDFTNLSGRKLFFSYGVKAWTGANDVSEEEWTFNLDFHFTAEKKHYGEGDEWKFRNVVLDNKSCLDLFKGWIHMIQGKVETNFDTKTVVIRPPKDISVFGDAVEGFFKDDEFIDLREKVDRNSIKIVNPDFTRKKDFLIGYKKTSDPSLKDKIIEKEQFLDNKIYLGDEFEDGITEDRNSFFEPTQSTSHVNTISTQISRPIALPSLTTRADEAVTYDIAPRILCFTTALPKQALLNNGTDLGPERIMFNGTELTSGFPYGFMTQRPNTLMGAPFSNWNIAYGKETNDLFSSYIRFDILKTLVSPLVSLDYLGNDEDFFLQDFRKRILLNIDGENIYARASEDALKPLISMSAYLDSDLSIAAANISEAVEVCNNYPSISGEYTEATNTYLFTLGGESVSPINIINWEFQYKSGGVWSTTWTSLGTGATKSLTDPTGDFKIRAWVQYNDTPTNLACGDRYTNTIVKNRCENYPSIQIILTKDGYGLRQYELKLSGSTAAIIDSGAISILVSEDDGVPAAKDLDTIYPSAGIDKIEITTATIPYTNNCPDTILSNIVAVWATITESDDYYLYVEENVTADYIELDEGIVIPSDDDMKMSGEVQVNRTEYYLDNALPLAERLVYKCNRATSPQRIEFIPGSLRGYKVRVKWNLK